MASKTLDSTETKSRIYRMLEKNPCISFATFGETYPDVRTLMVIDKENIHSIWFAVGIESNKVAQLRKNPNAAIYGCDVESMTEFRLFGKVELLSDSTSRQKVWHNAKEYFPEGIESMIVLRFDTDHGTYVSFDKESGTF